MSAGSAAAVTGARHGRAMATAMQLGRERARLVTSTDEACLIFREIFARSRGCSHEKFRCALKHTPTTRTLNRYAINIPGDEDVDFLSKVADLNKDGHVSPEEAAFGFRVWLCWNILHQKIEGMYSRLDTDGNGMLDADELEPYLVELNDGSPVTKAEVWSVLRRADANGDNRLDIQELTFATAVWYADIQGKKCGLHHQAMGKARRIVLSASGALTNVSQVVRTSVMEVRSSLVRTSRRTSRFSVSTTRTTITSRSSFASSNSSRSHDSMYSVADSEITGSSGDKSGFVSTREDDQAVAGAHGDSTPPTPPPPRRPPEKGGTLDAFAAAAAAASRFAEIRDRGFGPPEDDLRSDQGGLKEQRPADSCSVTARAADSSDSSDFSADLVDCSQVGHADCDDAETGSAEQCYPAPPPLLRFNISDDVQLMRNADDRDDSDRSELDEGECEEGGDQRRHRPSTASTSL